MSLSPTLRAVKGSPLTSVEGDSNIKLLYAMLGGAAIFPVSQYGHVAGQDITAALQAAIMACAAVGGGTVLLDTVPTPTPLNGTLITGANGLNAQIVMPLVHETETCTIRIKGISPPNLSTEGIAPLARVAQGSILVSNQTSGFVFGTQSVSGTTAGVRSYLMVIFEDFEVRTQPGGSGVDFARLIQFQIKGQFKVSIAQSLSTTSKPVGTYGIICPDVSNKVHLEVTGVVMTEGFERGLVPAEHFCALHYVSLGNVYGLVLRGNYHGMAIFQYSCEASNYCVLLEGTVGCNIFHYDAEHFVNGGKWYDFVADVLRVSGDSRLFITSATVVESNVGNVNAFVSVGGGNVKILLGAGANLLAAPPVPPGTVVVLDDDNMTRITRFGTWGTNSSLAGATNNTNSYAQTSGGAYYELADWPGGDINIHTYLDDQGGSVDVTVGGVFQFSFSQNSSQPAFVNVTHANLPAGVLRVKASASGAGAYIYQDSLSYTQP